VRGPLLQRRWPTHRHLCPAEAGFWGAFLVPGLGAEHSDGLEGSDARLVAAFVWHAEGPTEAIRYCVCAACCPSTGPPRGATSAHVDAGAATRPAGSSGHGRDSGAEAYVSRRDPDWLFWATCVEAVLANDKPISLGTAAAAPAAGLAVELAPTTSGLSLQQNSLVLAPPHFVARLPGDPRQGGAAEADFGRLRARLKAPGVAPALPPAFPLHRYRRSVLLSYLAASRGCGVGVGALRCVAGLSGQPDFPPAQ